MLFTSNFKISGKHPDAVAICKGVPKWFKGRRMPKLGPQTWALVKEKNEEKFRKEFREYLTSLNVRSILEELGPNAVLLCWENPGEFCHRLLVAEWVYEQTGVVIAEMNPDLNPECKGEKGMFGDQPKKAKAKKQMAFGEKP
jgi:hypothetical protein